MKDILPEIFTTNANSDDPIILRRFILLNGFYIVGILIFFMFAFVNIFITMNHMIALVDFIALVIFLFTFYRFRKKGNLEQATYIGIILLSIVIFIFVALNKNESFGLIWTIFIPIFSFSMLGHKKGLFITLLSLIS